MRCFLRTQLQPGMTQHCTGYCSGLIVWLGNTVWNIEDGSGWIAWELEHSNFLLTLREKHSRRRFQIHSERRDFEPFSLHFKNTRYWKRTIFISFVFYYYFFSILERGKKSDSKPFTENVKVLVSARCCLLFSEQSGCNTQRSFSIPHKYFLLTLYERLYFDKRYSSARSDGWQE